MNDDCRAAAVEIATVISAAARIRGIEAAMEADPRPRVWEQWNALGDDASGSEWRSGVAEAAIAFGVAGRAHRQAVRYLVAAFAAASDHSDRAEVERLRGELAEAWSDAEAADQAIRKQAEMRGW